MCSYKPKYRFLQPSNNDYIVIKGSQALQMERQEYQLNQLMKDYKNFFREHHKRMQEVSKVGDIKKQINLFKKQARNIQNKYEDYKKKSKKINAEIKKFNNDLKKLQITDILKDMIKNANKDLVEMYKKSFQQALNPNYKGGNSKIAEIIRNDLKFDENGNVSYKHKMKIEKNKNLQQIIQAFEEQCVSKSLVKKILEAIENEKDVKKMVEKTVTNKDLKNKILDVIAKLGYKIKSDAKINELSQFYSKNDLERQLVKRLAAELKDEISDVMVERDIAEREYLKYQGKYSDLVNQGYSGPKDAQYEQEYISQMNKYKKIFNEKSKKIKEHLTNATSESPSQAIRRFIQDCEKNGIVYHAYLRETINSLTSQ
jgi:hypothetical protein